MGLRQAEWLEDNRATVMACAQRCLKGPTVLDFVFVIPVAHDVEAVRVVGKAQRLRERRLTSPNLFPSRELLMGTRSHRVRAWPAIASVLALGSVAGAIAADPVSTARVPTKEMREKMAVLHEQMAACLRSEKPITECRTEMMQGCRTSLGAQGCPMMGLGRGMGMGPRMMQSQPATSGAKQ